MVVGLAELLLLAVVVVVLVIAMLLGVSRVSQKTPLSLSTVLLLVLYTWCFLYAMFCFVYRLINDTVLHTTRRLSVWEQRSDLNCSLPLAWLCIRLARFGLDWSRQPVVRKDVDARCDLNSQPPKNYIFKKGEFLTE